MPSEKDTTIAYAASCNPPRRVKKPRVDAATAPVHQQQQQRPRPQLLPKEGPSSAQATGPSPYRESSDEEDEYDPIAAAAPAPKRRGRKPGPMSRSARESQRKLNHSRIEKARRTKINETLATLSNIVNQAERERPATSPASAQAEEAGSKGDKEFKLDVLVKTVTYIEELMQKVKTLEGRSCAKCSEHTSTPYAATGEKRKRAVEGNEDVEIVEMSPPAQPASTEAAVTRSPTTRPAISRASSRQPGQSPCLPPISAWLPHPYLDPSCLSEANIPPSASQLPTPPLSGSFRTPVALSSQVLPALSLPGPAHPFTSQPSSPHPSRPTTLPVRPSRGPSSTSARGRSPPVSPAWTPEDETAASLLLQMSSSPVSSSSGSIPALTPKMQTKSLDAAARVMIRRTSSQGYPVHAETPSSLLGLSKAA